MLICPRARIHTLIVVNNFNYDKKCFCIVLLNNDIKYTKEK